MFCLFFFILTMVKSMKIRLGYVAIPLTLNTTCSKTITYTNYQKLPRERQGDKLDEIIRFNLKEFDRILDYNHKNGIFFFRLTSNLLPLVTHPNVHFSYYKPYQKIYREIGEKIKNYHIRVDMHPDQFVVLNSEREEVVLNTIRILKYHDRLLKELGLEDGKLILHVGSSALGKEESLRRFRENFYQLPKSIQKRIVLENDDKVYNILDVLRLCQDLKVPMVLDYHHFLCNNKGEKIEDYIALILDTWKNTNLPPKIHFSSPKNRTKKDFRSHSEYIVGSDFLFFLDILKLVNRDVDIMIEAKGKDRALFDLVRQIKYLKDYQFLGETTFLL